MLQEHHMKLASKRNIKRGGTTFNGVEGGPQHGSRASGEGALRSSSSNFPEPEVPQQAPGETNATADLSPVPLVTTSRSVKGQRLTEVFPGSVDPPFTPAAGRAGGELPVGQQRAAEPSSASASGRAEALQPTGQPGANSPKAIKPYPLKPPPRRVQNAKTKI